MRPSNQVREEEEASSGLLLDVNFADLATWVHQTLDRHRTLPSQHEADITFKLKGVHCWTVPLDSPALPVNKKLGIIPLDGAIAASRAVSRGRGRLSGTKVLVQGMGGWAIDVDLVIDVKFKTELTERPLPLLLRGSWGLASKLIARESSKREAICLILVKQGSQARIVHVLKRSLARNVDKDHDLAFVLGKGDLFVIHVSREVIGG